MSDLALELQHFLMPLDGASQSVDATIVLLQQLGWELEGDESDWPAIRAGLAFMGRVDDLADAVEALASASTSAAAAEAAEQVLAIIIPLIGNLGDAGSSVPALSPLDKPSFWSELGEDLFGYLAYRYLSQFRPALWGILSFFGVIVETDETRDVPFVRRRVNAAQLPRVFTNPRGLVVERYHWNDEGGTFDHVAFLAALARLAEGFGARPAWGAVPPSLVDSYYGPASDHRNRIRALSLGLHTFLLGDSGVGGLWLVVAPIPPTGRVDDPPAGLALFPLVLGSVETQFQLSRSVIATLGGQFASAGAFRLELLPGGISVATASDLGASIDSRAAISYAGQVPTVLVGSASASRAEIQSAQVEAVVTGPISDPQPTLHLDVRGGRVVIAGGSGDGFIQKLLPPGGIQGSFELGIDWSHQDGLRFRGSALLEVTIPIHQTFLEAIVLDSIYLGLGFDDGAIDLKVGLSGGAKLGPIAVAVQRIGVVGEVTFPESDGNLGKLNVGVGFLPPTGAGLMLDAGAVTGGGFVSHDEALARYAGILDLNFGEIGLIAVALITTKLPGGKKGYALFINIGVTFSPAITLPYNFNLQGCGGLLALNRSMDVEALRSGLKTRTLDSILFPEDPILNATKIINDSERVFPIEEGRFVIGPMAKLGWGANGLIIADIAIVIELPSPVIIAVLGQITAAFPKPDEAKVILHLDVLGVLDIGKKSFALDATLYDSKIIKYDLSGDMALRLNWGDDPQFAMSLGGFHPRYNPPPGFPSLRRLKLQLSSSKSFDLSCTVYQALTSNTLQMGAKLQLHAEACGVDVDGHLSMDTLICWSPFEFEVDIDGSVSARYKGHDIASVHLGIGLSGPTPWHAKGKAKVSVLCWDVTARFEKKWGSDERASLPKVDPREPFLAEVRNVSNWSGALLPRRHAVESLRSLEIAPTDPPVEPPLIVHPAGMLEVRQRLLPLGIKLELFANSEVTGHSTFDVELYVGAPEPDDGTAASEGSSSGPGSTELAPQPSVQTDDVKEHFARGQFKALSKSDRLSKPSYEKFKAGERAGPLQARLDGEPVPCDLEFESIVIRSNRASDPPRVAVNPKWSRLRRTIGIPALRRASLRHQRRGKFASAGGPRIDALDDGYVIVDRLTLLRATGLLPSSAAPLTMTEAEDLVADAISTHRVAAGSVIVVPSFEEEFA